MAQIENNLIRALCGEDTGRVPFWEVWFDKGEMMERMVPGSRESIEKTLVFAKRMGWEYLRCFAHSVGLPVGREVASDGTSHYVEGGFHSLSQLDDVEPPDMERTWSAIEEHIRLARSEGMAVIVYLPWCFHAVATAMGLEAFAYKTLDDMDFLHTAFEFVEERNRKVIREIIIPLGVDVVLFNGDCAYKSGLMVRPEVFRELVFDRTAETVALLREVGIPYAFHTDGKLDEVIPVLIELGFCAVHGVEAAANDLADIKARFGKEITLIGNMDVDFLARADPASVRRRTAEMLRIGSPGGRYIAACNTSPLDYVPDENYMAMVETIHAFGEDAS